MRRMGYYKKVPILNIEDKFLNTIKSTDTTRPNYFMNSYLSKAAVIELDIAIYLDMANKQGILINDKFRARIRKKVINKYKSKPDGNTKKAIKITQK